jgi:hypothetical protein
MGNPEEPAEPGPDDDETRRERAAQLHADIERLKHGEADEAKRPTPREFTNRSVPEDVNTDKDERAE